MKQKLLYALVVSPARVTVPMCVGATLLLSATAQAQNLFVGTGTNSITQFTPGGAQSTFVSGLNRPYGLAFNSAGALFETDSGSGNIYKFMPGGAQSIFASGIGFAAGLAFNSAGNLFVADAASGNIYEYTPDGIQSTFASGLNRPIALAFDRAGNLFETDNGSGNIFEFTSDGTQSTFASGWFALAQMAIPGDLPVPEPSTWSVLGISGLALLGLRRRN